MVDLNTVSIEGKGGLLDYLALLTDSRKKRGIRHSQVSILAVAICALLSGARCFIGQWLYSQSQDRAVAVDGKTLRGSSGADGKPVHLVSAFLQHEKMVIGQRQVDKKSNEITAFKPLLEPLDLEDKVVTADAMHTQVEHARFLVEDKKADYVFPVKQNQGNLFETIRNIKDEDFSPSSSNTGKEARTH